MTLLPELHVGTHTGAVARCRPRTVCARGVPRVPYWEGYTGRYIPPRVPGRLHREAYIPPREAT